MYVPKRDKKPIRRVCPVCNGDKVVTIVDKSGSKKQDTCPRCEGRGYI